jgi:DNA-binding transcriptional LysR family regulator
VTVNLKHLDLNLLVVFDVVHSTRNISRAAEQLAMSQPAVSNALARLRELLEDPLFVRARRGVAPTVKADQIAGTVREALAMIGRQLAPGELDLSTWRRHFRIIMPDALEPIMMPPILRLIAQKAPNISIEGLSAFRTDYIKELRDGAIDLACHVFPANTPDIVTETICELDLALLARRGHPRIGKRLDLPTFLALNFVVLVPELRGQIAPAADLLAKGLRRREVYTCNKVWALPAMIERTDLVAILPRWFFQEIAGNFDLVAHDIPVKLPQQHTSMIWHARNTADRGHIWLRENLMSAFRAHVSGKNAKARKRVGA